MAKTQTTMELVSTQESKEFKKKRMLEIRAIVAQALKKDQRIDLMNFEGTDIPRVICALQDEVMRARTRHTKATKHISRAKNDLEMIMPMVTATIILQGEAMVQMAEELEIQNEHLQQAHEDCITLDTSLQDARAAIRELR